MTKFRQYRQHGNSRRVLYIGPSMWRENCSFPETYCSDCWKRLKYWRRKWQPKTMMIEWRTANLDPEYEGSTKHSRLHIYPIPAKLFLRNEQKNLILKVENTNVWLGVKMCKSFFFFHTMAQAVVSLKRTTFRIANFLLSYFFNAGQNRWFSIKIDQNRWTYLTEKVKSCGRIY